MHENSPESIPPPERVRLRPMLVMALPLVITQLAGTVMQFADAWMVSVLGADALAAILPAGLLFFLPLSLAFGALAGLNTFVSQSLGREDKHDCGMYTWQAIYFGLAFGLALMPLWWAAPGIFAAIGHAPEVQPLEVTYFQISLLSAAPFLISAALSNFFIGIHRTAVPMVVAVITMLLNVAFNYVLIFGKLGFPVLGLAGAALGTVLATICQMAMLAYLYLRREVASEFGSHVFALRLDRLWQLLRIGLPAGVQFVLDILSWSIALIWLVGMFGTAHLAATTIIVRYMHLSFLPTIGLGAALTALVGKSIGEGKPEMAHAQTMLALRVAAIYMGFIGLLFISLRYTMIGWFSDDESIMHIGAQLMVIVALFQLFDAMAITFAGALRGAGDTLWTAWMTALLSITIFMGGSLVAVVYAPDLESLGPWIAGAVYVAAMGMLFWLRWSFGPWRRMDIFRG